MATVIKIKNTDQNKLPLDGSSNPVIATGELAKANSEVVLFSILSTLRNLYLWIPKKEDVNPQELSNNLSQILINGIINK